MNRGMSRRVPPRIVTPDFWPATFDRLDELLASAEHCQVEHIGTSAGGRAIHGVTFRSRSAAPTLGVVGGTHGHESQGMAACLQPGLGAGIRTRPEGHLLAGGRR